MKSSPSRAGCGCLCALAIISLQLVVVPTFAATYTGTVLYKLQAPTDPGTTLWTQGSYEAAYGGSVGGYRQGASLSTYGPRATLWSAPDGHVGDLNLPTFYSQTQIDGVSATQQIGFGVRTSFQGGDLKNHALLWSGTAASLVDLHPSTFNSSFGTAVGDTLQVGDGTPTGSTHTHALLWSGTADSMVDLHPSAFDDSFALAVGGGHQVGYGTRGTGSSVHDALLWTGTAASVVDLRPSTYTFTFAYGVDANQQVGLGIPVDGTDKHALLWSGSADSVMDLNPSGYASSEAHAVLNETQVGFGKPNSSSSNQALAWSGDAGSYVNLQSLLPTFSGVSMTTSMALSIDPDGNIWGVARDASNNIYAVEWSPPSIPEPGTSTIVLLAVLCLLLRRPAAGASPRPT